MGIGDRARAAQDGSSAPCRRRVMRLPYHVSHQSHGNAKMPGLKWTSPVRARRRRPPRAAHGRAGISKMNIACTTRGIGCTREPCRTDPESGRINLTSCSLAAARASSAELSARTCSELGWRDGGTFGSARACARASDAPALARGCSGLVSWTAARDACADAGARLCTLDELAADEARGTGCGYDAEFVWSVDGVRRLGRPLLRGRGARDRRRRRRRRAVRRARGRAARAVLRGRAAGAAAARGGYGYGYDDDGYGNCADTDESATDPRRLPLRDYTDDGGVWMRMAGLAPGAATTTTTSLRTRCAARAAAAPARMLFRQRRNV